MLRKIKIAVTTDQGVLLDVIEMKIPANHTVVHIISTKMGQDVIGADAELQIGRCEGSQTRVETDSTHGRGPL